MGYDIGDRIITDTKDITITAKEKQIRRDGNSRTVYKYICNICGFDCSDFYYGGKFVSDKWCAAGQIRKDKRCSCCASKSVKRGINSIFDTHNYLIPYFVDVNDVYKHTYLSNIKVNLTCPCCKCDTIKGMRISDLYLQGFSCPCCSDGLSLGEKIVYIILRDNNVNFVKEYVFNNSAYRYDFYIKSLNIIVEVNGKQHYAETSLSRGSVPFERQVEIDLNKKNFAMSNGVLDYIYIDCRKSQVDYILKSIYESGLLAALDIDSVDDMSIKQIVHSHTMAKEICELYDSSKDTPVKYICDTLNVHRTTAHKYLMLGAELGWCDYGKLDTNARMMEVCSLYKLMDAPTTRRLAESLNLDPGTILSYLDKGAKAGLCDYRKDSDLRDARMRKICKMYQLDDEMSIVNISETFGVHSSTVKKDLIKGAKISLCDYSPEAYVKSKRYVRRRDKVKAS